MVYYVIVSVYVDIIWVLDEVFLVALFNRVFKIILMALLIIYFDCIEVFQNNLRFLQSIHKIRNFVIKSLIFIFQIKNPVGNIIDDTPREFFIFGSIERENIPFIRSNVLDMMINFNKWAIILKIK